MNAIRRSQLCQERSVSKGPRSKTFANRMVLVSLSFFLVINLPQITKKMNAWAGRQLAFIGSYLQVLSRKWLHT